MYRLCITYNRAGPFTGSCFGRSFENFVNNVVGGAVVGGPSWNWSCWLSKKPTRLYNWLIIMIISGYDYYNYYYNYYHHYYYDLWYMFIIYDRIYLYLWLIMICLHVTSIYVYALETCSTAFLCAFSCAVYELLSIYA